MPAVTVVVDLVNALVRSHWLTVAAYFTTLGRTAARMLQTSYRRPRRIKTFDALLTNIQSDESTYVKPNIDLSKEYYRSRHD